MVFSSLADLAARIDDPALDVTPHDMLVLQNAGPNAPEACRRPATCRSRKKLAQSGVKDMIRVSDARMSGTAFGTIVLHVTPDSASGGPLGLVRNGDRIRLSVKARRIDLLVEEAELSSAPPWPGRRRRSPSAAMPGSTPRKSSAPTTAATSAFCGRRRGPEPGRGCTPSQGAQRVSIPGRPHRVSSVSVA